MYRVVEMYGDFEPWWFLDGWENDIIQEQRFEKYYDALKFYKIQWLKLETEFKATVEQLTENKKKVDARIADVQKKVEESQ